MRKIIVLFAAALIFVGVAAAQDNTTATVATVSTDSTPAPAAAAGKISTENGYPWQVGANFTYQRFDIGGGNSNLYGIHTSVTRWLGDSMFGIEGTATASFGNANPLTKEQVVFYGGGAHVGKRSGKFQPWGHILVGGAHDRFSQAIGPASFNALAIMGGGGVDIQWRSHIAWRVQADYLGTHFPLAIGRFGNGFGTTWQNSITVGAGILFDF
jgi:hypothetical protein